MVSFEKPKRSSWLLAVLVGIVGSLIVIGLFGRESYNIGALKVSFSMSPAKSGVTRVSVPPLGRITARTHKAPVALQASVEEASVGELRAILINRPQGKEILSDMTGDARRALIDYGLRLLALAAIGGAVAALVSGPTRRFRYIVLASISGVIATGGLLGFIYSTYDTAGFRQPHMTNALKATPWAIQLVEDGVFKIEEVDNQVRTAATNIYKVESALSGLVSSGESREQLRILAISDLHNNTVGMSFADNLAQLFDVDFILNAGDLTDFGTDFESSIARQVRNFDKPHIFVSGNHDSVTTIAALRRTKNTKMPHGHIIEVKEVKIFGQHNPASEETGIRPLLSDSKQLLQANRDLKTAFDKLKQQPDILIVHDPDVAKGFEGKVPIIVTGHDHILDVKRINGSVWVKPGSTGASGIRYLTNSKAQPMTAAIIYITAPPEVRTVAVDLINLSGPGGEFTVTRKKF
ncbi:MAG TPA: metallophosphoesterase [Armatimonadota bacterium]|nr:metallophosphoesterase [Armatimonadota bacterium]